MEGFLTAKQAARLLKISRPTLHRLIVQQQISAIDLNPHGAYRSFRISPKEIARFQQQLNNVPQQDVS